MIRAALRDLQWRRRRVVIALVATALVLTVAVVLTGLVAAIYGEADRSTYGTPADHRQRIAALHADRPAA
jgi:putative ABC transport system permease protein